jgi:hypothetical protein
LNSLASGVVLNATFDKILLLPLSWALILLTTSSYVISVESSCTMRFSVNVPSKLVAEMAKFC